MFEFLALEDGVPAIVKKMNFGHLVLELGEILRSQLAINTPVQKLPAVVRFFSGVVETGPVPFLGFIGFGVVRITLDFKIVAGRSVLEILLLDVGDEQHFPLPLFFLNRTERSLRHLLKYIIINQYNHNLYICFLLFIITALPCANLKSFWKYPSSTTMTPSWRPPPPHSAKRNSPTPSPGTLNSSKSPPLITISSHSPPIKSECRIESSLSSSSPSFSLVSGRATNTDPRIMSSSPTPRE